MLRSTTPSLELEKDFNALTSPRRPRRANAMKHTPPHDSSKCDRGFFSSAGGLMPQGSSWLYPEFVKGGGGTVSAITRNCVPVRHGITKV